MKLRLFLFIFIFFPKFNYAAESTVDPNLIHKNLRCLVCQGQSISDSNSDFAQTIKLVVKDLIDEGKTEGKFMHLCLINMETGLCLNLNLMFKIPCFGFCLIFS